MGRQKRKYSKSFLVGVLTLPTAGCFGEIPTHPQEDDSHTEEVHPHATPSEEVRVHETFQAPTCGYIPCPVSESGNILTLLTNCATQHTLHIPNGYTLNGAGNTLIAVDGATHFVGPILRNCGTSASYRNLRLMGMSLADVCDVGDDALTGIRYDNASGTVANTQFFNIRRGDGSSGCQEGVGIMVRDDSAPGAKRTVNLENNILIGYQKAGISATGNVEVNITGNRIMGAGPIGNIAQAGIQVGMGATGLIDGNTISGNTYTGEGVAAGILVFGGALYGGPLSTGLVIRNNFLINNDIGVYLSQGAADGGPPAAPTRIQVVENMIQQSSVTNGYVYQAGIADLGTANIIHSNMISGAGYNPATLPGSTYAVDVVAGPAASIGFLTPPRRATAGSCAGPILIQIQDASGNLARPADPLLNITAVGPAAAGVQFFDNPACAGSAVTTLNVDNDQAQARFYFRAVSPGSLFVFLWNSTLSQVQTQVVTGGLAPLH